MIPLSRVEKSQGLWLNRPMCTKPKPQLLTHGFVPCGLPQSTFFPTELQFYVYPVIAYKQRILDSPYRVLWTGQAHRHLPFYTQKEMHTVR